jgi:hypothetical protein
MRNKFVPTACGALFFALIATACASGGGGIRPPAGSPSAPADSPRSAIEGEWRLVSFELADGTTRRVSGHLRYDRFSTLSVHAELAPDDPAAQPPRLVVADFTARASPGNGEFDYVGLTMGVGAERLTPDAVNMAEWRHFDLSGDTLRLHARGRDGRPGATLVFARAR